jgi:predicted PurR-regulated permease PerM
MSDPPDADGRSELLRYVRKLLIAVAVAALALILYIWRHVILLAFGAALVALMLRALADPIRRRTPLGAGPSLAAAVVGLIVLVGALFWFVGAQVSSQVDQLRATLPAAWAAAQARIGLYAPGRWVLARVHEAAGGPVGGLGPIAGHIGHLTGMGIEALGELVVVLVAGVYFAAQPKLYREGVLRLAPPAARERLRAIAEECAAALRKWLLGTGAAMLAMGGLAAAGTALLGLPAPVALGLLSGLAEFVPIVGAAVSAVPGLLLAAAQGLHTALLTLAFYVAIHQFEGHILIPLIQRRVVAVPPALTLFSVVGFGVLFGPIGVVFATPLAVVALVLVKRLYLSRSGGPPADDTATHPVGARGKI